MKKLLSLLVNICNQEGCIFLGAAKIKPLDPKGFLQKWLAEGRHAGMEFMERNTELRCHPENILPQGQGVFMFALPYGQGDALVRPGENPRISQYARLQDYHKVMRRIGQSIAERIRIYCENHALAKPLFRVSVDSAPVLERALAASVSGFIGKNTCFIEPGVGSFILLGEIFTTMDLSSLIDSLVKADAKSCGTCKRCAVHCPTGALDGHYGLDANLCLAYWTIEHRGVIPVQFWKKVADYFFGCDICQIVCPFNRRKKNLQREDLVRLAKHIDPFQVFTMTQSYYEKVFGGTPVTRAKIFGLKRNALISMIVRKDKRLESLIESLFANEHIVIEQTIAQIPFYKRYYSDLCCL